jgi:hypothetical protein
MCVQNERATVKSITRKILSLSFAIAATTLSAGCAGHAGGITLTSMRTHEKFDQGFSDAYLSHNANGDLDVVLIDSATAEALAGHQSSAPVRQILHLRVLWQPERDLKVTDSAACNASVHWYVMRGNPKGTLEYTGTAFVSTSSFSDLVRVKVQNAQVRPMPCSAALHDPVGPSKLEGAVFAHEDARIVSQLLSEVNTPAVADAGFRTSVTR